MATCRGITYLLLRAAAPNPPASGRKSSAGPGCTECEVRAAFPKVWTSGLTSRDFRPCTSCCPSSTLWCCSAAPRLSSAPSVRDALKVQNGDKINVQICLFLAWIDKIALDLTCDQGEGADAGEGGDVQTHPLQVGGELHDAVDPLAEATQALQPVPHGTVAEDQLPFLRVGSDTRGQLNINYNLGTDTCVTLFHYHTPKWFCNPRLRQC